MPPDKLRALVSESDDNSQWSPEIEALIARAAKAGYAIRPRGEHPFGWHLIQGSETILEGVLIDEIRAELDKRDAQTVLDGAFLPKC